MDWFIIGTAGHVDHGKTELVKAITGQDTDRLKEEKKRGISIELGFASFELPSGKKAAIIDVPGHERFIKQMLAGVAGIDMVMLIIAADEGIMPQTKEHLDIIKLLKIEKGITVITKTDLVDQEWLQLVEEEIKKFLKGSILENSPTLKVSAIKKQGIEELINKIDEKLAEGFSGISREGDLRLPVDRSFTMPGFGTVVTGTLWLGEVRPGDTVEIQPGEKKTRVRGVQVHGKPQDVARAGQRVALNLSDVEVGDVPRGSSVVHLGSFNPSHILDAKLSLTKNTDKPLRNRQRVRVHLGTSEKLARIKLLDHDELMPGEEAFVQLQMETPLLAQRGDHFVIRSYSPMHTIGGGTILEPQSRKLKRYDEEILRTLKIKEESKPKELIKHIIREATDNLLTIKEISKKADFKDSDIKQHLESIADIYKFNGDGLVYFADKENIDSWLQKVLAELESFHHKYPLRTGISKEDFRTRFFSKLNPREYNILLSFWQDSGEISIKNNYLHLPSFTPKLRKEDLEIIVKIEKKFLEGGFQPPSWEEAFEETKDSLAKEEILRYLLSEGILIRTGDGIYFHRETIEQAKQLLLEEFNKKDAVILSEIRDLFNSSRKYILPLLEYLDGQKFTKRIGDKRVLAKKQQ